METPTSHVERILHSGSIGCLGHFGQFRSLWFHLESLDQFGKNYDNLIHLGSFEQFGLFGEFAFILVSCDSMFYFWSIL
jgi:hypothetical protein